MHLKVLYWNQGKLDVYIFGVTILEDFEGLNTPLNATVLTILKFFYVTQELQTYFTICSQNKAHIKRGVTPLQAEILVSNQPNFTLLLKSLCQVIATLCEDTPQWAEKPITRKHSCQNSRSMVVVDHSVKSLIMPYKKNTLTNLIIYT